MCGIAGIYHASPGHLVNKSLLSSISQSMANRGPDQSGFWYASDQTLGFAHNRLAIIDLHERAREPMQYLNGRYILTYNGEIYNFQELKKKLVKKKYQFSTNSDTEVLMAMYDCYGRSMLTMLRGMFAFAIWDQHKQTLFAARDPFGIKPFYYYKNNGTFVFASQVKAISNNIENKLTPCAAGWCGFARYGSVPEPYTFYEQIKALPAGHFLEISKKSDLTIGQYFSIYDEFAIIENTDKSTVDFEVIDAVLLESVDYHLVADVPVSLFLSSGIDSTVLASYLAKLENKPVAFTLDFEEFNNNQNESKYAVQTASKFQLEHHVIKVNLDNTSQILEEFFYSMDQPSIDGLNVWLISQAVAKAGYKAVISGLGADEVLAGYPSFIDVPKYSRILQLTGKIANAGIPLDRVTDSIFVKRLAHPKVKGFASYSERPFLDAYFLKRNLFLEQEFDILFDSDFAELGRQELRQQDVELAEDLAKIDNEYLKVSALELDNYMKNQLLRDADWASMYHSLELRVPFVDWPLIRSCATELAKITKPVKKEVIKRTLNGRIPQLVLNKEKTGFVTPVNKWLQTLSSLQSWKLQEDFLEPDYPWARRWAHEVKSRFIG